METKVYELSKKKEFFLEGQKENIKDLFCQFQYFFPEMQSFRNLNKEILEEIFEIKNLFRSSFKEEYFIEKIDEHTDKRIKFLALKIYKKDDKDFDFDFDSVLDINAVEEEGFEISLENNTKSIKEQEDLFGIYYVLFKYFDSYRMLCNSRIFKSQVEEVKGEILEKNENKELNFYTESGVRDEVVSLVFDKYKKFGFSEKEIKILIEFSNLEDLKNIPIEKINIFFQIKDIFNSLFEKKSEKTIFVALALAGLIPAMIKGYTPEVFAKAFDGENIDIEHVILYGLLSVGGGFASLKISNLFRNFLNKHYLKIGGIAEKITKDFIYFKNKNSLDSDILKQRAMGGFHSYEEVLKHIVFEVVPALVTMLTSSVMLSQRSFFLMGATLLGSGFLYFSNSYFEKFFKFLEKIQKREQSYEKLVKEAENILNAELEFVLSADMEGAKNSLEQHLKDLRINSAEEDYFNDLESFFYKILSSFNLISISASALASSLGGSSDVISGIMHSGNFNESIFNLLNSRRNLLRSIRGKIQMQLLFDGSYKTEKKLEEKRIDVNQLKNWDIEYKNVSFSSKDLNRKKERPVLQDVSFEIKKGEVVRFLGKSGSGKTVLVKFLGGLIRMENENEGVFIGGNKVEKIKKEGENSFYSNIVYLSQFPIFFPDKTIRENLSQGLFKKIADQDIKKALKDVGLEKKYYDLNIVIKNDEKSSGGEKQRLAFAKALLKIRIQNPKIIILDEPTASLDSENKVNLINLLKEEKNKRSDMTIILITHDDEVARMLGVKSNIEISDMMVNKKTVRSKKRKNRPKHVHKIRNYFFTSR